MKRPNRFSRSITVFAGWTLLIILSICHVKGQSSLNHISIFEQDGEKGILNAEGEEVIPARYSNLGWTKGSPKFHHDIIGYRESEKWGIINSNNKVITPPKYTHLYPSTHSNLLIAAQPGKVSTRDLFGVINLKGKVVIPFMYASTEVIGNAVIVKTQDGNRPKYGVVNFSNQPILPINSINIQPVNANLLAIEKDHGKIVLTSPMGKELIRFGIDSLVAVKDYYRIFKDGRVGLITRNGELICSPEYKQIEIEESSNTLSVLRFNKWEFLDLEGQSHPGWLADEVKELASGIFRITLNNQSWLVNDQTILSKPYDDIIPVSNRHFVMVANGYKGLINIEGREILPAKYDSLLLLDPFIYASIKDSGDKVEWRLFDTLGIQKNHFKYDLIKVASEGLIPVKRSEKWGFISREGIEMIHCVYDRVTPFNDGIAVVRLHGEEGIIDTKGNWLVFPAKREITMINDSLYMEKSKTLNRILTIDGDLIYFTKNKIAYEDHYFTEIIDSVTTWHISLMGTILNTNAKKDLPPMHFYDSLHIIYQEDIAGVVSSSGRVVIPFGEWDEIRAPTEELLGIKANNYYGFIDMDNKLRIANRYEGIGPFKEGLAAVKIRGKWGFVDHRENLVCQPLYHEVGQFHNGLCVVRIENKWGLLGKDGKLVQPVKFDSIEILDSGVMMTSDESSFGLLDKTGKTVLFPKYEYLEVLENDMILVKRRDEFGLFNKKGLNVIPLVYSNLNYLPEQNQFLTMTPGVWESRSFSRGTQ